MATHVRPQCPGDDVLAAYLDDRLHPDERRVVEEHLASCEDCRTILADSVLALEALDQEEQPRDSSEPTAPKNVVAMPARGLKIWPAIGLLAAAALAIFIFRDPLADAIGFGGARARANAEAALIAAMADHRTFEPRLAGGFRHTPLQVMRSGNPNPVSTNPDLTIAAARIAQLASRDESVDAQALLGAARLITGDVDGAIDALEAANRSAPPRANVLADLAAAYYVRAEHAGSIGAGVGDYTRAFDAAKKAVGTDPTLLEARFNLALATERTQTPADARLAWDGYLQQDGSSAWADEARKHLANLPR